MQLFSLPVFDEIITGTGNTWYTSTEFDSLLGSADILSVHAVTSLVGGTTPFLAIRTEHSADGISFLTLGIPINFVALTNDAVFNGYDYSAGQPLGLVRLSISLNGTNPQCRVKVFVTGRTL